MNFDVMSPYELGKTGRKEAIPFLLRFLRMGTPAERRLAASAARKLHERFPRDVRVLIPGLVLNLVHEGDQVRQYSITALATIGVPVEALGILSKIAQHDCKEYNRIAAQRCLKEYSDESHAFLKGMVTSSALAGIEMGDVKKSPFQTWVPDKKLANAERPEKIGELSLDLIDTYLSRFFQKGFSFRMFLGNFFNMASINELFTTHKVRLIYVIRDACRTLLDSRSPEGRLSTILLARSGLGNGKIYQMAYLGAYYGLSEKRIGELESRAGSLLSTSVHLIEETILLAGADILNIDKEAVRKNILNHYSQWKPKYPDIFYNPETKSIVSSRDLSPSHRPFENFAMWTAARLSSTNVRNTEAVRKEVSPRPPINSGNISGVEDFFAARSLKNHAPEVMELNMLQLDNFFRRIMGHGFNLINILEGTAADASKYYPDIQRSVQIILRDLLDPKSEDRIRSTVCLARTGIGNGIVYPFSELAAHYGLLVDEIRAIEDSVIEQLRMETHRQKLMAAVNQVVSDRGKNIENLRTPKALKNLTAQYTERTQRVSVESVASDWEIGTVREGTGYDALLRELSEFISDQPCNITSFRRTLRTINKRFGLEHKISSLTNWLMARGFLLEVPVVGGRVSLVATDMALEHGVTFEHFKSRSNEYYVNYYGPEAQEYIIREFFGSSGEQ